MSKVYVGIDETSLGIGCDSLLVVAATTTNPYLAQDVGYGRLKKSRDILVDAGIRPSRSELPLVPLPEFPSYQEMQYAGVEGFHWMRARGGRFSPHEIEHAVIAHLVASNGYDPKNTELFIDAFYGNHGKSTFLLKRYLHEHDFPILEKSIHIIGGADRSVPIVNYADMLAFQIGLSLNKRYHPYRKESIHIPITPHEIPLELKRVPRLKESDRDVLGELINEWEGV